MHAYVAITGFAVGVAAGTHAYIGIEYALLAALIAAAIFSYMKFIARAGLVTYLVPVALLGLALGIFRTNLFTMPESMLAQHVGEKIELAGTVGREPDVRESRVRLFVDADAIKIAGEDAAISERVLAAVPLQPEFEYGDRIRIIGMVAEPENFETENGRTFNYKKFLEKDGVRYEIKFAETELVERGGRGSAVKRALFGIKGKFIDATNKIIPEPQSSLLAGILLGGKSSLGEDVNDDFRDAGLAHIVVLSGYNIAIVVVVLTRVLAFLPRRVGILVGIAGIVLFVVMAGTGASAARAGTMAVLVLVAKIASRRYDALRGLMLAAFLMVLHNPLILLYDPSFELSFMATLSLILVSPLVEPKLKFVTEKWHIREIVVATVATQIFMLPFILYLMGNVSLVALPVNILVLPAIPAAMLAGFITGLLALVTPVLALVPGFVTHVLLTFVLKTAHLAASIPYASVTIPSFPIWAMVVLYAVYAFAIWKLSGKKKDKKEIKIEEKVWDTSLAYEIVE